MTKICISNCELQTNQILKSVYIVPNVSGKMQKTVVNHYEGLGETLDIDSNVSHIKLVDFVPF